jgi:transposase
VNLSFDELKELYNERWNIETSFNTLKNALEIKRTTAKKRNTVEQDFLFTNCSLQFIQNYNS